MTSPSPSVDRPPAPGGGDAYGRERRYLLCDQCGAPVEVIDTGGQTTCRHCRTPLAVRLRTEAALVPPSPRSEAERLAHLSKQDARWLPPTAIAALFAGGRLAPTRSAEAHRHWTHLRQSLRSAADYDAAEQLFFLTTSLAEQLFEGGDWLRQRALIESALELLTLPRHEQVLRAQLARSACSAGDQRAAEAWLATCEPRSEDLHADTAYRFARAFLDTATQEHAKVIHVLGAGADVPVSDSFGPECAVLRAHSWERLGQLPVAIALLVGLKRESGPLARRRARRFVDHHDDWQLCAQAEPEAERRAVALDPAPPYDAALGGKLLLAMAGGGALWTVLGIAGFIPALYLDDPGFGGLAMSVFMGAGFALLMGLLGWYGLGKARRRRELQQSTHAYAAHILHVDARPDPFFGTEGVMEVRLDLLVTPDDAPVYRCVAKASAIEQTAGNFTAGASVVVRLDPRDPQNVAVDLP